MRAPTSPAEQRAMEKAYESKDPFAVARWERPGYKFMRLVDQRTPGFGSVVLSIRPESPAFEVLNPEQTMFITVDTPDVPDHEPEQRPEPGA